MNQGNFPLPPGGLVFQPSYGIEQQKAPVPSMIQQQAFHSVEQTKPQIHIPGIINRIIPPSTVEITQQMNSTLQLNRVNINKNLIEVNPENICFLVGIPLEMTAEDVINQLRTLGFNPPIQHTWVKEGSMEILKLLFAEKDHAIDLLVKRFKIGPNNRYPVLALPYLTDRTVLDMLEFHEIEIKSSTALDITFCYIFFSTYGEIIDVIKMENDLTYTLAFTRQDGKKELIKQKTLRIPMSFEIIITVDFVHAAVPIKRKSFKDHIVSSVNSIAMIRPPPPVTLPSTIFEKPKQMINDNNNKGFYINE